MAKSKHSRGKSQQQYKKELTQLKKAGLYNPTSTEITHSRRTRINTLMREYGKYFDKDKFAFIKAPKPAREEAAKKDQYTPTRTGIFVPKQGFKRVSISYNKKLDEYVIKRYGRKKEGTHTYKIEDELLPLVSLDELTMERERLLEHARSWGKLRKNQYVTYILHTYGYEGYSHNLYSSADAALDAFEERYDKRLDFAKLYRELSIERTTVGQWKRDSKPHRPPRYFAGGKKKPRKRKGYGSHKGRG